MCHGVIRIPRSRDFGLIKAPKSPVLVLRPPGDRLTEEETSEVDSPCLGWTRGGTRGRGRERGWGTEGGAGYVNRSQ